MDRQRSRVYVAEKSFPYLEGFDAAIADIHQVRAWVANLAAKEAFRSRWGERFIPVGDGRRRRPCGGKFGIKLPRHSRKVYVILHEIAHHLMPTPQEWHGPAFCRTYISLVEVAFDREAAMRFEGWLVGCRCKVAPEPKGHDRTHDGEEEE